MSLWPTMASSPVLTRHAWSTPVLRAAYRNIPFILSGSSPAVMNNTAMAVNMTARRPRDDLLRPLVVLHVVPCPGGQRFAGWAQLSSLPDALRTYDGAERCAPSVQQMVTKAGLAREQYAATLPSAQAPPDRVYIASDDPQLVEQLKEELLKDTGGMWTSVTSSSELLLQGIETAAKQGVELELARRAALFVGNGVSGRVPLVCSRC